MLFRFFGIIPKRGIQRLFFFVGYFSKFSIDVKDTSSGLLRVPLNL
jgi:hypothetical protein